MPLRVRHKQRFGVENATGGPGSPQAYDEDHEVTGDLAIEQVEGLPEILAGKADTAAALSIPYAVNPAVEASSLAHLAGTIGSVYRVDWFNADRRDGSAGEWECIGNEVGQPVGTLTAEAGAVILHGSTRRYRKVLSAAEDLASYGVRLDGVATGQAERVHVAREAAVARRHKLTGAGIYRVASAADALTLGDTWLDLGSVTVQEAAGGVAADLISLSGGSIGTARETTVRAHGINVMPDKALGQYDFFGPKSLATGVVIGPDRNGNSPRHIHVNRLLTGCRIQGDFEKQGELKIFGSGNGLLLDEYELVGVGSPDTNVVYLIGQLNLMLLVTGNSTSGHYKVAHEGRIDNGTFLTAPWLVDRFIPLPAFWIRSGKFHWLDISEFRGQNGRLAIYVDKDYADGADTFRCDGTFVHCYGTILRVDRCQRLTGAMVISDNYDGRSNHAVTVEDYPCAAVQINQVYDAGGFRPVLEACSNREGYRIGNTGLGFFPTKVDFCLAGAMRGIDVLGQPSGPNGRTGFFPRDKKLIHVERMESGSIDCPSIDGFVALGAGAQGVSLRLPASFVDKGYDVDDLGYQTHIEIVGRTKFSHIGHKPFLAGSKTVSVGAIRDYGGAPAGWKDGRWSTACPWAVTTAELERATSDINWKFKRPGLLALDSTTGLLMVASGADKYAPWTEVGGAATVTPLDNPLTAALVARMTVAPSARWREIYDRILNDWAEFWPDLGRFHLLGAHDRQASRLCWKDAANDLTEHGALTWVAGRGFAGSGSAGMGYLSSGFVPGSIGETNTNVFVGAHVLKLGPSSNGDVVGSDTKSVRLRAAIGANNRSEVGTTSILSWTTAFAEPRSIAASTASAGALKAWDNGVLRATAATDPTPLPAMIDILRGYDIVNMVTRYGDEEIMLVYYGKNPTDARMARAAQLADDIMFMTGAA